MKKQLIIVFIILSLPALAQSPPQPQPQSQTQSQPLPQPVVVPLWKNGAPGFEDRKNIPEESKDWWVKSINNPSLTVFTPPEGKSNGCAVIVAPGGGFRELVFDAEGRQVFLRCSKKLASTDGRLDERQRIPEAIEFFDYLKYCLSNYSINIKL